MKEAIKLNTPFYFVFNNQKYMGEITGKAFDETFRLTIYQISENRFLFWKYEIKNKLYTSYRAKKNVEYEIIGTTYLLSPSSVKKWMAEAIDYYNLEQVTKKLNKTILDNVKHINELY